MSAPNIQPVLHKAAKKSFLIRALACILVIVFAVLVGYITGRILPNECGKSVLGAQWPTFPSPTPTPTPISQWPHPATPTPTLTPTPKSQWPTFPSPTPTPTPTPTSQWLILSPTPTPVNHWPTFSPTPTPAPTGTHGPTTSGCGGSHGPTTGTTSMPITPDKLEELTSNIGITLINPGITTSPTPSGSHGPTTSSGSGSHGPTTGTNQPTANSDITFKGNMQDKILGLIQISYPATLSVNANGGITVSTNKSWWQKIFTNPFSSITSGLISCTSLTGESSCIKNGCTYWSDCGKCEATTTPYNPTCSCSTIQSPGTCNSSVSCEWHPECAGGGACVGIGSSSKIACSGCGNIIGQNACYAAGCTYSNNQCQ